MESGWHAVAVNTFPLSFLVVRFSTAAFRALKSCSHLATRASLRFRATRRRCSSLLLVRLTNRASTMSSSQRVLFILFTLQWLSLLSELTVPNAATYHLPSPTVPTDAHLAWKRLCNAADLVDRSRKMSKEEELLRERQRQTAAGITTYDYDEVRQ